jgi:oxaloacetate decarboxylase gamma subunit
MPCPQHIKFLNTHATMIEEGLELMLVGMGVVFSFLVLLVILMRVSGALLSRLPEPEVVVSKASSGGSGGAVRSGEASAKLAVALAAAHRERGGA